jgi:hypothetical protein
MIHNFIFRSKILMPVSMYARIKEMVHFQPMPQNPPAKALPFKLGYLSKGVTCRSKPGKVAALTWDS